MDAIFFGDFFVIKIEPKRRVEVFKKGKVVHFDRENCIGRFKVLIRSRVKMKAKKNRGSSDDVRK